MVKTRSQSIQQALRDFAVADRARRDAVERLLGLGAIRSRSAVGDIGEGYAAAYYGVELAPPSTPGYDLKVRGKRVQVRTLRCTERNFRTTIGALKDAYDVLFAIRLDEDYLPIEAIHVPRPVVEERFPSGRRVTWTVGMSNDPRVRRISAEELLPRKMDHRKSSAR